MSGNSIIWITWGCFILRWFTFFIIHLFVKISGLTTCVVSDVDRSDSRGRRNLIRGYLNFENPKNLGTKILTSISKDSTSFSFKTPQPGFAIFFWHRARPGAVLTPCNFKIDILSQLYLPFRPSNTYFSFDYPVLDSISQKITTKARSLTKIWQSLRLVKTACVLSK